MAPPPKSSIHHFSHPCHSLNSVHNNQQFLCDGCKTLGTGKRHRCNGCDFDLHDYCGTCPRVLSSFMHHHHLTLLIKNPKKAHQIDQICYVCRDPIDGMFYRCKECAFDVHPLCTQLPEKLHHALHNAHPLTLQSSLVQNFCGVCRNSCKGWRYRCGVCNFGIHLECVLEPVVGRTQHEQTTQRGTLWIPFQPPPQFGPCYGPGYTNLRPNGPSFGVGFNMNHGGPYYYAQQNFGPHSYQGGASNSNGAGGLGKSMFSLVGQLGFGVISNMLFGVDVSSLFAG